MDNPGFDFRQGQESFLFTETSIPAVFYSMGTGGSVLGGKAAGTSNQSLTPSSAENE